RISMDFAWRVPGLGDSLVLYGEFFQDDEPAPFVTPGKAAIRPGIHLVRIPGIPKLGIRLEYASTESPWQDQFNRERSGLLNYWNGDYRDGYVNRGVLLGNAVGRAGQAIEVLADYTLSPQNRFEFHFKDQTVFGKFVPGGGRWQDYGISHVMHLRSGIYFQNSVQVEHIRRFPILFPGSQANVAASITVGYQPEGGR
ncbi:MAG: capsule assembly Wzi family protein, partial [Acidobacteriales bacterium]|nr:capsule assembly Wzi family protein [Terriglobales bacterium]